MTEEFYLPHDIHWTPKHIIWLLRHLGMVMSHQWPTSRDWPPRVGGGSHKPAFVDGAETCAELWLRLWSLPPPYGMILVLHFTNDFTYGELAKLTGISRDTLAKGAREALEQISEDK